MVSKKEPGDMMPSDPIPPMKSQAKGPGNGSTATTPMNDSPIAVEPERRMPDEVLEKIARGRSFSLDPFTPRTRTRPANLLLVDPPRGEIDGIILDAGDATSTAFGGFERVESVGVRLLETGISEQIAKLTDKLNRSALDRSQRWLLSLPGVYASLILEAMDKALPPEDTIGLYGYVLRRIDDAQGGPRVTFAERLVDIVLAERRMVLGETRRRIVIDTIRNAEIPLKASKAQAMVLQAIEIVGAKATASAAVESYALRKEIDPRRFTAAVKRSMTNYLADFGVQFDADGLEKGNYDEYLAIAYHHALRSTNGGDSDPIDVVRRRGAVVDWDFRVDAFDSVEEQGVVPDNIRAAGALDYLYQLGDRMGLFRLLDAFTLAWARGDFDLERLSMPSMSGEDVQSLMFRYHKLRNERVSPEERAMLYRRILDKGDGTLLGGTQPNRAFSALWTKLLSEVTDYIRRNEESPSQRTAVSRQRVYEAIRQLQINLSERMAGMARLQVTEMYHQFREAKAILESEQMLNYYGAGPRRSMWTVVERGKRELLNEQDNLSALLTVAVEGNKVFQHIADFDPATFTDIQFEELADACEAIIIAESVLAGADEYLTDETESEEDDSWADDEADDDLENWDE